MSNQSFHFVGDVGSTLDEAPEKSIVSRSLFRGAGVTATLFSFAEGEELTEHTAASPAILHFLSGTGMITLEDETRSVAPNTWVYMPAQLPHSIVATSALRMLLLLLRPEG